MNDESYINDELTKNEEIKSEYDSDKEGDLEEIQDKVALMGVFIRDKSYEGCLTNAEDFLDEPLSLEVDEVLPMIDELTAREEFSDICVKKGKEKIYLFSENHMTKNYAKMMISVEEKDLFKIIAETVREESKIYPRPTDARLFNKTPFKLSKEEFNEVYDKLRKKEEYSDIQETRASNNALYLYSERFMKKVRAASLAEWIEVEAGQNP
ncbi:MAG: hypothetical protein WBJ13_00880 [Sedimentibacter sp.]